MSYSAAVCAPAYAQPGDVVSAFYGEHFGGVQDNDIGLSAQPGNRWQSMRAVGADGG